MTDSIRQATAADLNAVKDWLRAEDENSETGFYCNWSIILRAYGRGDLIVLAANDDIVGFISDDASGAEILEIRVDARGNGYGRRLAEWMTTAAFGRGNSVLQIECSPETSKPFWKRMGFIVSQNNRYAHKILERPFDLIDGPRKPFEVSFYPEARGYKPETQPFRIYTGEAVQLRDGSLQLPERAICFTADEHNFADCIVQIKIDGTLLFEDKVKRPEAECFGVRLDVGHIYYLDKIFRPNAAL